MKTAVKVARAVLVGSGALVVVLGLIIWTGNADGLIGIHELLAYVLVLSLWTIAAIAARSGVSWRLVTLAVAWSVVAAALGGFQEKLAQGDWHWTIQVLHLVVGMGIMGWGQVLVIVMRRKAAASALGAPVIAREDLVLTTMGRIEKGARDAGTAPETPVDPRWATGDGRRRGGE